MTETGQAREKFTGFHPTLTAGKTFAVFASSVWKKAIAQLCICWTNFRGLSKAATLFLAYLIHLQYISMVWLTYVGLDSIVATYVLIRCNDIKLM